MTELEQVTRLASLTAASTNYFDQCCLKDSENTEHTSSCDKNHHNQDIDRLHHEIQTDLDNATRVAYQFMGRWADEEDDEDAFIQKDVFSPQKQYWENSINSKPTQKPTRRRYRSQHHSRYKSSSSSSSSSLRYAWRKNTSHYAYNDDHISDIWNPQNEKSFQLNLNCRTGVVVNSNIDVSSPKNFKQNAKTVDEFSVMAQPDTLLERSYEKCLPSLKSTTEHLSHPLSPSSHASNSAGSPNGTTSDDKKPYSILRHLLLELSNESAESDLQNRNVSIFGCGRPRTEMQPALKVANRLYDLKQPIKNDQHTTSRPGSTTAQPTALKKLSCTSTCNLKVNTQNSSSLDYSGSTKKHSHMKRDKKNRSPK